MAILDREIVSNMSLALICRTGPEIGGFKVRACVNHIINASSISECAANRSLFLSGMKLVAELDALTIFCLFFTIEVTVLLATPNSSATADLDLLPLSTASIIFSFFAREIGWWLAAFLDEEASMLG